MLQNVWSWLSTPWGERGFRPGLLLLYVFAGVGLLSKLSEYHIPEYGFTYLIGQGDEPAREFDWIEERDVTVYRHFRSSGYDAQYYAQLAIDPVLQDPTLIQSVDNVPYRARRILLPWTAYLFGLGQPNWVLNVFALQNVVCWFLLGWVLLTWFPPTSIDRAVRWLGVMLSGGIWFSAFSSLVDGPSLLMLALALRWIDRGQTWRGTAILALSGLAKETNIMGAAALSPPNWKNWRGWGKAIFQGLLVAVPLVAWFFFLRWRFIDSGSLAGARNFAAPFTDYFDRWASLVASGLSGEVPWKFLSSGLATHLSVTVQAAFLLLWWQWRKAAWRLAVPFAVLAFVLGQAVWEGYPGASSRVLLPLLLGFNLLVPVGRRWWLILLLGNATVFVGPTALEPRPGETYSVRIMNREMLPPETINAAITVEFPRPWYRAESNRKRQWRWSEDDADILITNPYSRPLQVEIRGAWSAQTDRTARVIQGGSLLWQQHIGLDPKDWRLAGIRLKPGLNRLRIESDTNNTEASPGDERRLAVCLLRFAIKGRLLEPES